MRKLFQFVKNVLHKFLLFVRVVVTLRLGGDTSSTVDEVPTEKGDPDHDTKSN